MSEIAIDFGTSNTVISRYNESLDRAETIPIPGFSSEMRYRLTADGEEQRVWVVPSLIHYSATETLIGDQVISRGLAEHPDTMRWMKRGIAHGIGKRRKTSQGHKSPADAGEEFLTKLLRGIANMISLPNDSFTFTAPVEAFENFQDWLWRLAESLGIRHIRMLDEPTACIFGYHGVTRQDERFVVFDFGGGTLDVSAVRIDLSAKSDKKAIQLGQAGHDLGGIDIDQWLADDFVARHRIPDADRKDLEALILRKAEEVKIALSDPAEKEAEMSVLNDRGAMARILRTNYRRSCPECESEKASRFNTSGEACLGCILAAKKFLVNVRETLDRALENAAVKSGMRRSDVTRVLVTGGTSLVPCVRRMLDSSFNGRVVYDHPFDCVVRGACRGVVAPILVHDYAIESYNHELKKYEFEPLFKIGEEYPTRPDAIRFSVNGSCEGQIRIGLMIYEVSRMKKKNLGTSLVDADGIFRRNSNVTTDNEYIGLNSENPTFIIADPPINLQRDQKRFLCSFAIDGNKRLVVTVVDNLSGAMILKEHPVVRL